jgi:hypothetical protein
VYFALSVLAALIAVHDVSRQKSIGDFATALRQLSSEAAIVLVANDHRRAELPLCAT